MRAPIRNHLVNAILNQIRFEREGYVINRSAAKGSVEVFSCLDTEDGKSTLYELHLEPAILAESEAYYKAEGEKLLQLCDAPAFLKRVCIVYCALLESSRLLC
jgi:cullin 3